MTSATHEPRSRAGTPTRPSSAWTNNSLFADSAISLRTGTPAPAEKELNSFHTDGDTSPQVGIADRLNRLVSEIWACEHDGAIRGEKSRKLEYAIEHIEAALDDDSSSDSDLHSAPLASATAPTEPAPASEDDLGAVRASLASTVESMRMRQQEQKHLHQLAVEKLEAVAQRCIQQERRLKEFAQEMVLLKQENRMLNEELQQAHTESAKKHVAVDAMSSAVAGLEGWINGTPTPDQSIKRVVTRGRGRFRGRYYVDEHIQAPVSQTHDGTSDAKALHDGVNAWLRGFRDVEEELKLSEDAKASHWREPKDPATNTNDEWGDFESATGT